MLPRCKAQTSFQLFEKKYGASFAYLQLTEVKLMVAASQRAATAMRFCQALYTEAMLVGAFTNPDKEVGRATAHEQLQRLAAERVERELVHPLLVWRAEKLVQ